MTIEKKDVEFIIKHFEPPPFPRRVSTIGSDGKQYVCESLDQCMEDFALSKWIDCRINAYNYLGDSEYPSAPEESRDPSFIMIDLDRKVFPSEKAFQSALRATMRKIKDTFLLNKDSEPATVLHSGGGAHFLIPLECDPAKFDAPQMHSKEDLVRGYNSNDFIRFCARFFSNGHVDKGFFPSTNSIMVRIPGGINSKYKGNKAIVQYIIKWDVKTKGHILCLLGEFCHYMQREQQQKNRQLQHHWKLNSAKVDRVDNGVYAALQQYWYIKELLGMGIRDFRKRAICLLLAPYCITILKMDHDTAERTLLDWTDKCQVVKPLDFNAYKIINQALKYAEARQRRPLGLFNVKDQSLELYTKLMSATDDTVTKEIRTN